MAACVAGPLAALVDAGRDRLADELQPGRLTVGPAARPYALALLAERAAPLLVVTATDRDVDAVVDDLGAFLGEDAVAAFPAWETLPHERLSPQPATVGQRLAVLHRLRKPEEGDSPPEAERATGEARRAGLAALVAPVRALLQPMDPRLAERDPLVVDGAYAGGLDGLVNAVATLGYTRGRTVEQRGEFAVRGGLVDVFPTASELPVRIEFFGDDVDSLRRFHVADQRSEDHLERAVIDPAREVVLDADTADTARRVAAQVPELADELGRLADGVAFEGMEALVTAIHPRPAHLPDFLPAGAGLAVIDAPQVAERAEQLRAEARELLVAGWTSTGEDTSAGDDPGATGVRGLARLLSGVADAGDESRDEVGFADWDTVRQCSGEPQWELSAFGSASRDVPATAWDSFRGDMAGVAGTVRRLAGRGATVVLTAAGHGSARRLAEVLRDEGVAAPVVTRLEPPEGGRVAVVPSTLREGFHSDELGVALLGEWDLFGPRRSRSTRRLPSRRSATDAVLDLEAGDYVVHATHGVGRYAGVVTRTLGGPTTAVGGVSGQVTRDYVVVEYAGGDTLYVPGDQVDALTKYVGGEQPAVMRLGGGDWQRARHKVKESVKEMAGELVRLYQARMHATGRAFGPDTPWQRELEEAFPHTETEDQLGAIDDVKADLEAHQPMDRLVCGDVGYGKTEIAVRAAAKAVFDGAQVAVLVPTTLLAQQHGETFTERFSGFPVEVRVLSRFASPREQKRTLDGLAAGTVDIVVGTHRLLGSDVAFKDLGLMVVDEEQRFGVAHKEQLKRLRTNVDVLTMTATPIPRTMELAITGVRDLSTIDTPPEDRQPVVTHVGEYDEATAALAVRRELLREGQVFWVHNQVDTIDAVTARVRELVPGARVAMAHGRMSEDELEQVMVSFWHREHDVLVSTTIVESGLDIPNANTLIVERTDLMGLAQIYQLRGRIGRSARRGYAYLFFPQARAMTEQAHKRLEAVAEHTGLGSGMSIALKDLEIRGAGDLLSGDQSGHVASVGMEEYGRIMAEAVTELTDGGEPEAETEPEIRIDLPVDAHLPADYIDDEGLRLEAYKRVASVRDSAGVKAARAELVDRFGPLPEPAERLLAVAALRAAARRWGITAISTTPRRTARVEPVVLSDAQEVRLARRFPRARYNAAASALELPLPSSGDPVAALAGDLKALLAP
jgi:transcription-repair coupling factor (superfamily II helicase)